MIRGRGLWYREGTGTEDGGEQLFIGGCKGKGEKIATPFFPFLLSSSFFAGWHSFGFTVTTLAIFFHPEAGGC